MRINHTKARLANGETVFGCAIQQFRSAEVARVFAAAGFDYAFIDMEHGAFDLETVQDMIAASVSSGITPIIRVAELAYSLVARVLDAGGQGIIFPRVEDPKLLAEAISWTKFPPLGKRGYAVAAPLLDYQPATFPEIIEHMNRNTLVVVQFETQLAMERSDELLAVPGIDVAMVGPADLSVSLGVPGQFEHPSMIASIRKLMEACQRHKVVPGIQVRTTALAKTWTERGMRFVGAGGEVSLLLEEAKRTVSCLRAVRSANAGT